MIFVANVCTHQRGMHASRRNACSALPDLEQLLTNVVQRSNGNINLRRERSDGLYSTVSYLLSKMVEEMVVILFVSLVVSACIFFAVGFHGQYILFWLVYLVTISIGMGARVHACRGAPLNTPPHSPNVPPCEALSQALIVP